MNTRKKLSEAKYFYDRMKDTISNPEHFGYNLSAFLSAARSVTFFMQKEYKDISGFTDWYTDKQSDMKDDREMNILNEKRTQTIHRKSIDPRAYVDLRISEHIHASESISIDIIYPDGSTEKKVSKPEPRPKPAKTEVKKEWRWYFEDMPDKDIINVCKEHMVKLENLVTECESIFKL